ncbi:hypothetical protein SJ322_10180 [Serratia marcescens]|uniref:hypothetical protein n=1 Tax=Serratia marcescens TaxID=615 RepID=UPI0029D4CBC8|nr:hypothetical protein [Serratia marcescens]MDX7272618.1 hypothetical protein [Serratia marcescens]
MTQTPTTEKYTEGLCGDGAAILCDGVPMSVSEILATLNAAVSREAQPVAWGSPKTVGQLIGQLKTLDPAMETTALLRMPDDFQDGNAVKQVPITISFEKLNGHWLAPYKGDGRKVLAFWAKADHREETERGELFTAPPATAVPDELSRSLSSIAREYQTTPQNALFIVVGWNACRAAVLAQPVSSGYTLPEGFKLVPVESTDAWAERYCELTNKHPDGGLTTYIGDGAVTITFREKSKREIDAMLAAAPEGGNDNDTRR